MADAIRIAVLGLIGVAVPLSAQADGFAMSPAERAAFGAEIRALLLDEPGIVTNAMNGPDYAAAAYRDAANADLILIDRLAPQVLGDADIALFVAPGCGQCERAQKELHEITKTSGATFILHDMSDSATAAVAATLGLSEAPFYVMRDRILRGHMPAIALMRYLDQR